REEGPQHHCTKTGTPTPGGVIFLLAAAIAFLALSRYKATGLTVFFAAVGCGAIGFLDDFTKLTKKRSLGLSARWKMLLLACVTAVIAYAAHHQKLPTTVYIPGLGDWQLSYAWYFVLLLVIAAAANGVNLAGGMEGLG